MIRSLLREASAHAGLVSNIAETRRYGFPGRGL